ncbi:hypothetical protein NDU88_001884 [Pleurodeles waltl]|uniref:Uncharacterized protein n=1 Tax=Pleurodeles waltl TaxID=8319 RepID=A0AAV7Q780_PLEWA|nr:hypothetical protein NDU88_001884 [Pleurodeles waltl]
MSKRPAVERSPTRHSDSWTIDGAAIYNTVKEVGVEPHDVTQNLMSQQSCIPVWLDIEAFTQAVDVTTDYREPCTDIKGHPMSTNIKALNDIERCKTLHEES